MKFKKSLGYFHHREQNILHQISKTIVSCIPNSIVYLISSDIQHLLSRNIYTKPQRIESWKHQYELLILLTELNQFDDVIRNQLTSIHSDIASINFIPQKFDEFLLQLSSNNANSHWILQKSLMIYGCEHMIAQLPPKRTFSQEEEELIWFQYLANSSKSK